MSLRLSPRDPSETRSVPDSFVRIAAGRVENEQPRNYGVLLWKSIS